MREAPRRVAAVSAAAEVGDRRRSDWDGALGDFAAVLAEVERRLDEGGWEEAVDAFGGQGPALPDEAPTAEQAAQGRELLARAERAQARLGAAMASAAAELGELDRRREAAAGYLMQERER